MARQSYRYNGEGMWHAMSGNALLVLANNGGSGKKISVGSIEVANLTMGAAITATSRASLRIYRATASGGEDVPVTKHDTNATLPAGIRVARQCSATLTNTLVPLVAYKRFSQTGIGLAQQWTPLSRGRRGSLLSVANGFANAAHETLVARPGEALVFGVSVLTASQIFVISGRFVVDGSPMRTYSFTTFGRALAPESAIVGLINGSATDVVRLVDFSISEAGTFDSPYLMAVPVGALTPEASSDMALRMTAQKLDTAYPDFTAGFLAANAAFLPYGVPQSYLAEGSTGSPKGYNYLQTKDFIGPAYAVMFPERTATPASADGTTDGKVDQMAPRYRKWFAARGAPIVIRPGEALAIVSAAETAAGATAAVGTSGWSAFDFAIQFDVENETTPFLTLTGLATGSDVVILSPGTSTVLTSVDSYGSSTFSWAYDQDTVTAADICIYKPGKVPLTLRNVSLGASGVSIPIAQADDRNYSNP